MDISQCGCVFVALHTVFAFPYLSPCVAVMFFTTWSVLVRSDTFVRWAISAQTDYGPNAAERRRDAQSCDGVRKGAVGALENVPQEEVRPAPAADHER